MVEINFTAASNEEQITCVEKITVPYNQPSASELISFFPAPLGATRQVEM